MLASSNSIVIMVYDPYSRSANPEIVKGMSMFLEEFDVREISVKHEDERMEMVWKKN